MAIVTLLVGALTLLYIAFQWFSGGWKKRGVSEAKSYPIIGSFPSVYTQGRHVAYDVDDVYRQFKNSDKFVGVYSGRIPQLLITDPELVHNIYVNDFKSFHDNEFGDYIDVKSDLIMANNPFVLKGEAWKERRMEIAPGMSANRIRNSYPITLKVCKRLTDFIKQQLRVPSKDGLDTLELCLRYTTEVVSDCILGVHVATINNKTSHLLNMIQNLFKPNVSIIIYQMLVGLFPTIRYFYKMSLFPKSAVLYLFDLMGNAIDLRRKQGDSSRADYLNYLLELQDKNKLPNQTVASNIMTFLTDGFVTTAHTIGHCLLGLARNADAQEILREEILRNINEEGIVTFESLSEMPYLDACFHESLRLFPPLVMTTKLCTRPYEFLNSNGKSWIMKTGEVVLLSHYSLHHDERFYEDPEEFKPERFLPENGGIKKYRDEGKYLGFGNGPRTCMGMRFALTQGKAVIVELLRHFRVQVNPKTRSDNLLDKSEFSARLDGGVWLNFEAIK